VYWFRRVILGRDLRLTYINITPFLVFMTVVDRFVVVFFLGGGGVSTMSVGRVI
jgi:ABC-type spermidine/putrescine transport system permease subunit II